MAHAFSRLMFTPRVKAEQARLGSRGAYARFEAPEFEARDRLGPQEIAFIAARDSFYMATVTETGWPYVQHRGGPAGFLTPLDDRTLAFADFRGNRQYVSLGALKGDDRVSLILMDYPNQARLKLLGRVRVVEAEEDPALMAALQAPGYRAHVERAFVIALEAFDWNCPQHITPRFTLEQVEALTAPLRARVAELEARLPGGPEA
ncbi:pyridoxamine 5'-phosphate oxidase family protein [Phenylobacterium sp.]|uniref:pyridoxamine 5'-phosphate oxidase family protein n=1 Tax=Phenylobacterium sp. TaxID=1871053 RepID=UPI0035ADD606